MFAKPREKKGLLIAPSKKRKTVHTVEEINFDNDARSEYLTGFRKRKQARIKHAQGIAAEKARQEKIQLRKQMRTERKEAMEEHVQAVNKLLKEAQEAGAGDIDAEAGSGEEEWDGIHDEAQAAPVDLEEEYIDEDRYTTVTIESVTVDREGLHKPEPEPEKEEGDEEGEDEESGQKAPDGTDETSSKPRKEWPKKKKKFRYETKFERQLTERKRRAKARR